MNHFIGPHRTYRVPVLASGIMAVALWTSATSASATPANIPVTITVDPVCTLGTPDRTSIDLNTLINVSGPRAGQIAPLSTQPIAVPAACNVRESRVSVSVSPMVATGVVFAPEGFSRAVNYSVSAVGWTSSAVTASTAASSNPASATEGAAQASGLQPEPWIAPITLTLSGFETGGGDVLRLVAAEQYRGEIIVTLSPASVTE